MPSTFNLEQMVIKHNDKYDGKYDLNTIRESREAQVWCDQMGNISLYKYEGRFDPPILPTNIFSLAEDILMSNDLSILKKLPLSVPIKYERQIRNQIKKDENDMDMEANEEEHNDNDNIPQNTEQRIQRAS